MSEKERRKHSVEKRRCSDTVMKRGMRSEASVSGEEVQRECVMRGRDAGSIM